MFILSFTALFLEMMVIRWVPSVVQLVAYYANLMLLSSFLGLGVGAMLAERKWRLFEWFPVLLTIDLGVLLLCRGTVIGTAAAEARFYSLDPATLNTLALLGIFAANALLFVPLGQRMGALFHALPRLPAYGWDLAGSLCGTLSFGLFSLKLFSPVAGLAIVMAIFLLLSERRWLAGGAFAGLLALLALTADRNAIWSPYYYITVNRIETPHQTESAPPAGLRTMRNPPLYGVKVNQLGYHYDATFDLSRYDAGSPAAGFVAAMAQQYQLPYTIARGRERVLILGTGGGTDVEAALAAGVRHVDAVEIDPVITQLSQRFNAAAPYADSRVAVHIDDARAYVKRATPGYDLVVFGFLDSQALFSSMSNVRLDGFVYTVESLRTAYGLLNPDGVLALSFYLGSEWLGPKLFRMVAEATGRPPAMYLQGKQLILIAPKNSGLKLPAAVGPFVRALYEALPPIPLATDDWPFLYLYRKTIPADYLLAIGSLLAFSIGALVTLRRGSFGREDGHFMFLGMAFLLLETKSIGDCTLFFGTTWLVTMVVVAGVLLMVMAGNLVAARLRRFSFWMYLPLLASLLLPLAISRETVLAGDFSTRLLWALFVVPLPIFFAGLVFSTTFRAAKSPSAAFGANLIGAMLGGFCEYLAMVVGSQRLSLLVMVLYLGSLLLIRLAPRGAAEAPA